jgi:hypothetical protein
VVACSSTPAGSPATPWAQRGVVATRPACLEGGDLIEVAALPLPVIPGATMPVPLRSDAALRRRADRWRRRDAPISTMRDQGHFSTARYMVSPDACSALRRTKAGPLNRHRCLPALDRRAIFGVGTGIMVGPPGSLPSLQAALPSASDAREACLPPARRQGRRAEGRAQRRLRTGRYTAEAKAERRQVRMLIGSL